MTVVNTSFLNQNLVRKYPLAEDATAVSDSSWVLIDSLIADLTLSVPISQFEPGQFYISQITNSGDIIIIDIGYYPSPSSEYNVAQVVIDASTHQLFDSYPIQGLPGFEYVAGRITIGSPENFGDLQVGLETFAFTATRLSVSAIRPTLGSVTALVVNGQRLIGDINIVALDGVSITTQPGEIAIKVDPNSIDFATCGCADNEKPILSINGVTPDADGDIKIRGANCMEIIKSQSNNELVLKDNCSSPCCDCTGLTSMVDNLETISPLVTELNTYVNQLKARIDSALNYVFNR